jgi:hypothetical protein
LHSKNLVHRDLKVRLDVDIILRVP